MLTGGPCGGKTTGQAHLATFFESLGWKVFRVPETATVLMSGGIAFGDLNEEQVNYNCREWGKKLGCKKIIFIGMGGKLLSSRAG